MEGTLSEAGSQLSPKNVTASPKQQAAAEQSAEEGSQNSAAPANPQQTNNEVQANYERQMKQLAADEASDDDEFQVLDLKIKINEYY